MTGPIARAAIALDAGRVARHLAAPDREQPDAVRDWLALLEAGRIGAAQPAPAAEVIARRAAADALFRRIAAGRRDAGG